MSRPIRLHLILLLVLAGTARGETAAPSENGARAAEAPPRARRAEANRHFKAGLSQLNAGNPNAALAEFEAAHAILPSPVVQYNIGLAQKELFRYPEAIAAIERYLADPRVSGERRREAEALVAELRAQIVDVTLAELPDGARVVVDGRWVGDAPLGPIPMVTGRHLVEITADGFVPARREVSIAAGMEAEIPIPLIASPKNCMVLIDANVLGAAVRIDGEAAGETPVAAKLAGGGHSLEVTAPGYLPYRGELAVTAGQTRHVEIELSRVPKEAIHRKWWPWTILGLGVAGGATAAGIVLGSRAEDPYCGLFAEGCGRP